MVAAFFEVSATCARPSNLAISAGSLEFERFAPANAPVSKPVTVESLASLRSELRRLAPVRPAARTPFPGSLDSVVFCCSKFELTNEASWILAPVRDAPERSALRRDAPERLASMRTAPERLAP